jgi:integrase
MKGHVRERSPGHWAVVVELGRDEKGKRRQKWHSVPGKKRDAERELSRLLHEMNTGAYVEPSRMSVGDYLKRWLEDYARTNVAPKTYERYEEIVMKHLSPTLGQIQLSKLQPLQIQSYYSEALVSGRRNGKGGLSPQTVLHHHRVLREALQQGVRWLLLARNPADAVEPPRPRRREMKALDSETTGKLLRATQETRLSIPVMVAVTTGLRRGEILGLRWEDVDFENATLAVRQSLEQTRAGLAFKPPKTTKARRVVALPGLTIEMLKEHKKRQAARRLGKTTISSVRPPTASRGHLARSQLPSSRWPEKRG